MGVVYVHDDSESVEDSFTIQLTDGRHHVLKQVTVKVLQVNDEKPQLTRLDQHFPFKVGAASIVQNKVNVVPSLCPSGTPA